MQCKVYYSDFDTKEVNKTGWGGEEGQLMMKLTNPLPPKKSIDALDEAIKKDKYRLITQVELSHPEHAWSIFQNLDDPHRFNDRSMMIGDVVICKDGERDIGKIVESIGWSDLNEGQLEKFG